jgi:hypothetical protein
LKPRFSLPLRRGFFYEETRLRGVAGAGFLSAWGLISATSEVTLEESPPRLPTRLNLLQDEAFLKARSGRTLFVSGPHRLAG